MKELTLYPADLANMTVAQLAAAPIQVFLDAERNVDEAIAYLKPLRTKLDAAKVQRFGEQARAALRDAGRDFGTAHLNDGVLHVKYELPKKVTWNPMKRSQKWILPSRSFSIFPVILGHQK